MAPDLSNIRRPQTTDTDAFWYMSLADWNALVAAAPTDDSKAAKLLRYSAAGRMMETAAGMTAPTTCFYCSRPGGGPCMVMRGSKEACAYCRCKGKSHCIAWNEPELSNVELTKEVAALKQQVQDLTAELQKVKDEQTSFADRVQQQMQQFIPLFWWLWPNLLAVRKDLAMLFRVTWGRRVNEPSAPTLAELQAVGHPAAITTREEMEQWISGYRLPDPRR